MLNKFARQTLTGYFVAALILVLGIIGAIMMNYFKSNLLTVLFLIIIFFTLILFSTNLISPGSYGLLVFTISLALLLNYSLISNYLVGWDIHTEYYFSSSVVQSGHWDPSFMAHSYNSALGITVLAPVLSYLLGANLVMIFKVLYPILFSFTPICMFYVFKRLFEDKVAFLSTLLFLFYAWSQSMAELVRYEPGFFLLSLSLMLLFRQKTRSRSVVAVFIILISAFITQAYAYAILLTPILIIAWILPRVAYLRAEHGQQYITKGILLIYLTISISWFLFTSLGQIITYQANTLKMIINNVFTNPLTKDPFASEAIGFGELTSLNRFSQVLQWFIIISMLIGLFSLTRDLIQRKPIRLRREIEEYVGFSLGSMVILLSSIILPYFTQINFGRIYHFSLLFLSALYPLGAFILFGKFLKRSNLKFVLLSITLILYFLFQSGFIYEISGQGSKVTLNSQMDYPRFSSGEIQGFNWLSSQISDSESYVISADKYGNLLLSEKYYRTNSYIDDEGFYNIISKPGSEYTQFYYLRSINIAKWEILEWEADVGSYIPISSQKFLLMNKLCDNGMAQVYLKILPAHSD